MAVSPRLRYEILNRDGFACRYCHATDVRLTVDHVVPTSLGGTDDPTNLVACCEPCNSGKASSHPEAPTVAALDEDAVRWARAQRLVNEERSVILGQRVQILEWIEEAFYGRCADAGKHWAYPDRNWRQSVSTFLEAGLTASELDHFISIAANAKVANAAVWRYFCGCCWNEIRQRQEMTRDRVDREDEADGAQ